MRVFLSNFYVAVGIRVAGPPSAGPTRPERFTPHPNLKAVKVDALDTPELAKRLNGHDAAVSAFSGHAQKDVYGCYLRGIRSIIDAAKQARLPRLLVVGGAGSLEAAPGVQLVDTPDFPAQWKASALGAREALKLLRAEREPDWTMLSPSAMIAPGKRTGKFRLGVDQLLFDAAGKSEISLEDYSVAMIDELEKPAHRRSRFTGGVLIPCRTSLRGTMPESWSLPP